MSADACWDGGERGEMRSGLNVDIGTAASIPSRRGTVGFKELAMECHTASASISCSNVNDGMIKERLPLVSYVSQAATCR